MHEQGGGMGDMVGSKKMLMGMKLMDMMKH